MESNSPNADVRDDAEPLLARSDVKFVVVVVVVWLVFVPAACAPAIILLIPRRFIPVIAVRPAANNDMVEVVMDAEMNWGVRVVAVSYLLL